jgi:uridine monophosphate synthetase
MGFFTQLEERAKGVDSLLCIGLDPHPEELSSPNSQAVQDFCMRLVEATSDLVLAFKPNIAFFEVYGTAGIAALEEVINSIPKEIPIILDAKRGDIASSAQAYAQAIFDTLGANAVTVNPYLGYDALAPFLEDEWRGVFLLCKTSNPGAADIQNLKVIPDQRSRISHTSTTIYEFITAKAVEWNKNDNLGLVVGATQIEALSRVRNLAPNLWILAPGIGAQGGDLHAALQAGLRSDSLGMVVPVSRGISRASDPRQAAEDLNSRINHVRKHWEPRARHEFTTRKSAEPALKNLAIDLLESGCVKFGQFELKSGLISPIYIDLRRLVGYPDLLIRIADFYLEILGELKFDHVAALPYAGLPIATAISLQGGLPLVYPRKETKSYGTRAEIEGVYSVGEKVVLIDDLATTGSSKFEAIDKLDSVGLKVKDVVVLIDRQSGASEDLAESGYNLHAIFTLSQLLKYWQTAELISEEQVLAVEKFISVSGPSAANHD